MSLKIIFYYLEVVVQYYICLVWGTNCDFFRASVYVHHKQIWREAQEVSFTKAYFELGPQEFCPVAFIFVPQWPRAPSALGGTNEVPGTERGQRSASILEMVWKTESVEKCVREDRQRGRVESWKELLKLESVYFLHLLFFLFCWNLPAERFLLSAEEKCSLS